METTNETPTTPVQAPVAETPAPAVATGPEKVKRSQIDTLFQQLAYAEATTWTEARLAKKIRTLEPILEKDPAFVAMRDKLPQDSRDLYEKLKKMASTEDGAIDVEDDRKDAITNKKDKKAKTPKATKPAKTKKPGTPPASKGSDRDVFGCSKGSRGYDAMALLVSKGRGADPMKVKDIVEQSGHGADEFVGVFYNFLNGMVQKGLLIKTDKGYRMSAAGWKVVDKAAGTETPADDTVPAPAEVPTTSQEVAAPAA